MHHHKIEDREYLLVGIDNPYAGSIIEGNKLIIDYCHLVWSGNPPEPSHDEWHSEEVDLPPGKWQLVGTSDALGEEQARELVGTFSELTNSYTNYGDATSGMFFAVDSFATLLHSLSITRCAILIRVR